MSSSGVDSLPRRIDGLDYSVVKEDEHDQVLDFLFEDFFQEEACSKSRGGHKTRQPNMVQMCREMFDFGLSVAARDPASHNELAGVVVCATYSKSDPKPPAKSLSEYREIYGDNFGTVVYLLFVLYGPGSLFKACPDAEKAVDIEFLSVSKKYRKRGIGGNLTKLALEVAAKTGCNVANIMTSSPYTKKICENLGFKQYEVLVWEDIRVDGESLYPNMEDPIGSCQYKMLR